MFSELTTDQFALLFSLREKWIASCLSTEAADRATAEEALSSAYDRAGLKRPRLVIWMDSPLAGHFQAAALAVERERQREVSEVNDETLKLLLELFEREGSIRQPAFDCGESVLPQLREGVDGELNRRLGTEVAHDAWVDVRDAVSDRGVSGQIHSASYWGFTEPIRALLGVTGEDPVPEAVHDVITVYGARGQHDAWWPAFCEFFEQVGLLQTTESLAPIRELVRSCGWWWAFENAAILTERPRVLRLDQRERPHSESGPAVEYPDGFGFHAWHGVRVPAGTAIDVESQTIEQIDAEPNGMLRAALIDAFGKQRYLSAKGAELVHEEGRWGSIYRITGERGCTALYESGNGSCAFSPVPAFVQTGRQAWALGTGRELTANDNSSNAPFGVG